MSDRKADYEVMEGDSSALIKVTVEGEDSLASPWVCDMFVVDPVDLATRVIEKTNLAIDATSQHFEAFLTGAETDGLDVGVVSKDFLLCFEIQNPDNTPHAFKQTIQKTLRIIPKVGA
jgi:hypothetical protein